MEDRIIDDKDIEIMSMLQGNGRITNADIARRIDLAPSAVLERVRKLEARGAVRSYEARLDPRVLDLGLLAFVFVRAD
jgi:Lrp/AsnC family leucine-responsive transcriptional regulator